jgi:uncharacterized protein (TIGR00730 family)
MDESKTSRKVIRSAEADAIHSSKLRRRMASVIEEYQDLDAQLRQAENTNYRVCIFGSARIRRRDPTWQMVYMLAKRLGKMGIDIVTGGGPGLMEAANRAVRDARHERAKSYGLPLDVPTLIEPANRHLDIKSAHQRFSSRLDEFMRLSHAIIVAPGGIGTLLELMYVWQLIQIGLVEKRPVILIDKSFWSGFLEWMQVCMEEKGFIDHEDLEDVVLLDSRDEVVEVIAAKHEEFLQELERTHAGGEAPPVSVTSGQPIVGPAARGAVEAAAEAAAPDDAA